MNHSGRYTPIYENDIYLFILNSDFCLLSFHFHGKFKIPVSGLCLFNPYTPVKNKARLPIMLRINPLTPFHFLQFMIIGLTNSMITGR